MPDERDWVTFMLELIVIFFHKEHGAVSREEDG